MILVKKMSSYACAIRASNLAVPECVEYLKTVSEAPRLQGLKGGWLQCCMLHVACCHQPQLDGCLQFLMWAWGTNMQRCIEAVGNNNNCGALFLSCDPNSNCFALQAACLFYLMTAWNMAVAQDIRNRSSNAKSYCWKWLIRTLKRGRKCCRR